jgi:predicted O-methyltransferase YrrM
MGRDCFWEDTGMGPWDERDFFLYIKWRCNGMLHERVYEAIYEAAASAGEGVFLEVGTAHAAATVCLALGKRHGKYVPDDKIYSVEKIIGGSRSRYGGVEENLAIIRDNLSHFGVDEQVELLIGDVEQVANLVPAAQGISLLMLDADGHIDRDFFLFYNSVNPGGRIIIDDYADAGRLARTRGRKVKVSLKHR